MHSLVPPLPFVPPRPLPLPVSTWGHTHSGARSSLSLPPAECAPERVSRPQEEIFAKAQAAVRARMGEVIERNAEEEEAEVARRLEEEAQRRAEEAAKPPPPKPSPWEGVALLVGRAEWAGMSARALREVKRHGRGLHGHARARLIEHLRRASHASPASAADCQATGSPLADQRGTDGATPASVRPAWRPTTAPASGQADGRRRAQHSPPPPDATEINGSAVPYWSPQAGWSGAQVLPAVASGIYSPRFQASGDSPVRSRGGDSARGGLPRQGDDVPTTGILWDDHGPRVLVNGVLERSAPFDRSALLDATTSSILPHQSIVDRAYLLAQTSASSSIGQHLLGSEWRPPALVPRPPSSSRAPRQLAPSPRASQIIPALTTARATAPPNAPARRPATARPTYEGRPADADGLSLRAHDTAFGGPREPAPPQRPRGPQWARHDVETVLRALELEEARKRSAARPSGSARRRRRRRAPEATADTAFEALRGVSRTPLVDGEAEARLTARSEQEAQATETAVGRARHHPKPSGEAAAGAAEVDTRGEATGLAATAQASTENTGAPSSEADGALASRRAAPPSHSRSVSPVFHFGFCEDGRIELKIDIEDEGEEEESVESDDEEDSARRWARPTELLPPEVDDAPATRALPASGQPARGKVKPEPAVDLRATDAAFTRALLRAHAMKPRGRSAGDRSYAELFAPMPTRDELQAARHDALPMLKASRGGHVAQRPESAAPPSSLAPMRRPVARRAGASLNTDELGSAALPLAGHQSLHADVAVLLSVSRQSSARRR